MQIFPYFLARIGGAAFHHLESLNNIESIVLIEDLNVLEKKIISFRSMLCDLLHEEISECSDSKIQNQLLNLKRSIFNGRKISENEKDKALPFLTEQNLQKCLDYFDLLTQQDLLNKKYEESFRVEIAKTRENLKKAALDENLQKGLLLSSQALLNNIPSYLEADVHSLRKKELKTEDSLVKYITRMSAKTSPFSTFTNLAAGKITSSDAKEEFLDFNDRKIKSHLCLNNNLYNFLKGLLFKLPEIYQCFRIRPNSTIRNTGEEFIFLTNNNNTEAFQRIPHNPVVELFQELTAEDLHGVVYKELINNIIENEYFDATREEVDEYIQQLLSYGFLEFNIEVSGIDPFWDTKLVEVLEPLKFNSTHFENIIFTLKEVRRLASEYENADLKKRRSLIQSAYDCFREMCMKLHEAAGLPEDERKTPEELQKLAAEKKAKEELEKKANAEKVEDKTGEEAAAETLEKPSEEEAFKHSSQTYFFFKAEQIFYEDTTANAVLSLSESECKKFLQPLYELFSRSRAMDGFVDEMEKMTDFFIKKYGEEQDIELMVFYEDYYRDVKKPEAERINKLKEKAKLESEKKFEQKPEEQKVEEVKPITELEITLERRKLNKQILEDFAKKINIKGVSRDEVKIEIEDLQVEKSLEKELVSFGAFIQPFKEDGVMKAVINASFPGFGKMFSRFLHILPSSVTETLRKWNQANTDEIMIENCDASFFNANLHPPLLANEIWMPGGQNSLPAEKQVPVTSLKVRLNKQKNNLILKHDSGKMAYVFDLGFQGHKGRSQLFQLLSKFTLSRYLHWAAYTNSINNLLKAEPEKNSPNVQPRILLNENIVLQRKCWYFKKEFLPVIPANIDESGLFLLLNKWRKEQDLPDEVFIFMTSHQEIEMLKPEQFAKIGRDGYKPQYINFNNPLLVNLFGKMMEKVPSALKIEEMLPNSKQMVLTAQGEKYVTELVLQWYENGLEYSVPSSQKAESIMN